MAQMHKIALSPDMVARVKKRRGGKMHAYERAIYGDDAPKTWTAYMEFASPEFSHDMLGALTEGAEGAELWHELDIQPGDEHVIKRRFSALIQGSSDLGERLQKRGIDTMIITGTATNICCESTARDAFMLNYRPLVVSDANATASDEAHNNSLNALFTRFADVFSTSEVLDLLAAARPQQVRRAV
jgi:ureidoacrylate peracid hydrolase